MADSQQFNHIGQINHVAIDHCNQQIQTSCMRMQLPSKATDAEDPIGLQLAATASKTEANLDGQQHNLTEKNNEIRLNQNNYDAINLSQVQTAQNEAMMETILPCSNDNESDLDKGKNCALDELDQQKNQPIDQDQSRHLQDAPNNSQASANHQECSNLRLGAQALQNIQNGYRQLPAQDALNQKQHVDQLPSENTLAEGARIHKSNQLTCNQIANEEAIQQLEDQLGYGISKQKSDNNTQFKAQSNQPMVPKVQKIRIIADILKKGPQGDNRGLFDCSVFSKQSQQFINEQTFVLVSYRIIWIDGITEISDQFLWPKLQRDLKTMKMFAVNFLSDIFGSKQLGKYLSQHVNQFACFIAFIINREIDLNDHLSKYSPWSMVLDGKFSSIGNEIDFSKEQLVQIDLKLPLLNDSFMWDISNPDNIPEQFASQLVHDLDLQPAHDYTLAVAYEIRKQVQIYICQKVQGFTHNYENYLQYEIDHQLLNQQYQAHDNIDSFEENNADNAAVNAKVSNKMNLSDKFMKEDQFSSLNDSLKSFVEENCISQDYICSQVDGHVTTNLPESKEHSNQEIQVQNLYKQDQQISNKQKADNQIYKDNQVLSKTEQKQLDVDLVKNQLNLSDTIFGPSEMIYHGQSVNYILGCCHKDPMIAEAFKQRKQVTTKSNQKPEKFKQLIADETGNQLPNSLRMQPTRRHLVSKQAEFKEYYFLAEMVLNNQAFKPHSSLDQITEQLQKEALSLLSNQQNELTSKETKLLNEIQGNKTVTEARQAKKTGPASQIGLSGLNGGLNNLAEECKFQEAFRNEKIFCIQQDREHSKNKLPDNPFQSYHLKDLDPLMIEEDDDFCNNGANQLPKSNGQPSQLNSNLNFSYQQKPSGTCTGKDAQINQPKSSCQADQNMMQPEIQTAIPAAKGPQQTSNVSSNHGPLNGFELNNKQIGYGLNQAEIHHENIGAEQLTFQNEKVRSYEFVNKDLNELTDSKTLPNGTIVFHKVQQVSLNLTQNKIQLHDEEDLKPNQLTSYKELSNSGGFDIQNEQRALFNSRISQENYNGIQNLERHTTNFGNQTRQSDSKVEQVCSTQQKNKLINSNGEVNHEYQQNLGKKQSYQEHFKENHESAIGNQQGTDQIGKDDRQIIGELETSNKGLEKETNKFMFGDGSRQANEDWDEILEPRQKKIQLGFAELTESQPVNNKQF